MSSLNKTTKWFKTVAIIAIIWNVFGLLSYLMHAFMSSDTLEALPKNQQEFMNNMPSWRMFSFAIATFGGLIASIFLLLKKKIACPLFLLSLIAIIAGDVYDFFMVNYYKDASALSLILPILILFIAIFLFWYARKMKKLDVLV